MDDDEFTEKEERLLLTGAAIGGILGILATIILSHL